MPVYITEHGRIFRTEPYVDDNKKQHLFFLNADGGWVELLAEKADLAPILKAVNPEPPPVHPFVPKVQSYMVSSVKFGLPNPFPRLCGFDLAEDGKTGYFQASRDNLGGDPFKIVFMNAEEAGLFNGMQPSQVEHFQINPGDQKAWKELSDAVQVRAAAAANVKERAVLAYKPRPPADEQPGKKLLELAKAEYKRLNHWYVWNGRAKAKKIDVIITQLEHALPIDAPGKDESIVMLATDLGFFRLLAEHRHKSKERTEEKTKSLQDFEEQFPDIISKV